VALMKSWAEIREMSGVAIGNRDMRLWRIYRAAGVQRQVREIRLSGRYSESGDVAK